MFPEHSELGGTRWSPGGWSHLFQGAFPDSPGSAGPLLLFLITLTLCGTTVSVYWVHGDVLSFLPYNYNVSWMEVSSYLLAALWHGKCGHRDLSMGAVDR